MLEIINLDFVLRYWQKGFILHIHNIVSVMLIHTGADLEEELIRDIKLRFELVGGTFIHIELALIQLLKENQNLVGSM